MIKGQRDKLPFLYIMKGVVVLFFGRKKEKQHEPWRNGVYLTTVQTTFEADIIASKLEGEGIPCIRRYEGGGNYLEIVFGQQNVFPIEIYVPENALEAAKEAIVSVPIDDDFEEAEEDTENE